MKITILEIKIIYRWNESECPSQNLMTQMLTNTFLLASVAGH